MLINCPTPHAALLIAVNDASGVLRCPLHGGDVPGLIAAVQPLMPINPQLMAMAATFFEVDVSLHLAIEQGFADPVVKSGGQEADVTLYLARLAADAGIIAEPTWPSIPMILRGLSGRARIPYLRAWQVLAGGLHLNTKAVDAAEVAKYFDDKSV
jgi:hypothetical protein